MRMTNTLKAIQKISGVSMGVNLPAKLFIWNDSKKFICVLII
jgi:hypothetical protein